MRDYEFYYTQDGSIGLYSYADDDVYHSKYGALTEAWEKFILPSGISKNLNQGKDLKVLDICYGVGYNTKALMSYVINTDEKLIIKKNIFQKLFLKIKFKIKKFKKFFKKNNKQYNNIVSIDDYNNFVDEELLLQSIESIVQDNTSKISIDCLEIKDELVKLSPFLKTFNTPQEIFTKIIPRIFDCFDTYWIIRKKLAKFALDISLKNRENITEALNLKYNNDYDVIDSEYKIHKFVNYILIDSLVDKYKDEYLDKELKNKLRKREFRKFFDKDMIKYAKFKQDFRYNFMSKFNLGAFLHNIYYDNLSERYEKMKFKDAAKLFKLNFYVNDARKSILSLNSQYDYVFLDAFTYSKAPELWTVEFFAEIYKRLSPLGVLMTYSNSAQVRNTLLENNFYVGKILDKKTGKCIGTIAAKEKTMIEHPLTSYEMGLCNTKAGIPYHDYNLASTREVILKNRENEFKESDLMTSSKYLKVRTSKNEDTNDDEW